MTKEEALGALTGADSAEEQDEVAGLFLLTPEQREQLRRNYGDSDDFLRQQLAGDAAREEYEVYRLRTGGDESDPVDVDDSLLPPPSASGEDLWMAKYGGNTGSRLQCRTCGHKA